MENIPVEIQLPHTERSRKLLGIFAALGDKGITVDAGRFTVLIRDPDEKFQGGTGLGTYYHLVMPKGVTTRREVIRAYLESSQI